MNLLITLLVLILVVALVLWLINTYLPLSGQPKTILNAIVVLLVLLRVLQVMGMIRLH